MPSLHKTSFRARRGAAVGIAATIAFGSILTGPLMASAQFIGDHRITNNDGSTSGSSGFEKPVSIPTAGQIAYCVNMGKIRPSPATTFEKGTIVDSERASQLAYILEKYGEIGTSDSTAAVYLASHMLYDVNEASNQVAPSVNQDGRVVQPSGETTIEGRRAEMENALRTQFPAAYALYQAYRADAEANAGPYSAVGALPTGQNPDGTATITGVGVKSARGNFVQGENVTLELTGPATFADGSKTVTIPTTAVGQDVAIKVTGYGQVNLTTATTPSPSALQLWNPTSFIIGDQFEGWDAQVVVTAAVRDSNVQTSALQIAPALATTAVDDSDGDKFLAQTGGTIKDTVSYTNLIVGQAVTVKGELMDKATGQKTGVKAETTFTPTSANATVDVVFKNIPASLAGKTLVVSETLFQGTTEIVKHEDINDAAQTVVTASLGTTATDAADGDKNIAQAGGTVKDTLAYTNLKPNTTYSVSGELVDKATGQPTGVTASSSFTTGAAPAGSLGVNGTAQIIFTLPATLAGKTLVAFETIKDDKGVVVAEHRDISDIAQTVYVSKIGTTAKDASDGDKNIAQTGGRVVDTIKYENLTVGTKYTVKGALMEKATGADGKVTAKDTGIVAETTFTPTTANGTVDVSFTLPADAEGKTLVAYEKIYNPDGSVQGTHEDINDVEQTVFVSKIRTKAWDASDKDKTVAYQGGKITDTITYENLTVGTKYTAKGTLMEKITGADGKVTAKDTGIVAETTFTPTTANGTVDVSFTLPADAEGKTLVVFEKVIAADSKDGAPQGTHEDINDVEQTVFVSKIRTTLADVSDGDKTVAYQGGKITDAVKFENLVIGKEYTIEGTLMEKIVGVDGVVTAKNTKITASKKFTPTTTSGSVNLDFDLPADVQGKTLVAYEKVINPDLSVQAAHEDINDSSQTVFVSQIATSASDAADGDKSVTYKGGKVVDKVDFKNLVAGTSYTLSGELMEKVKGLDGTFTAKATGVTASKQFTPTATNGSTTLEFTLPDELEGKTLVVFEKVVNAKSADGKPQAAHEDINSESQTVYVSKIRTLATDAKDGDKQIADYGTLNDKVMYSGLEPGQKYTIKGEVFNQVTGVTTGIVAEKTFVAQARDGEIVVPFNLGKVSGTADDLVVFETLYNVHGDVQAAHKDINDRAQTVQVFDDSVKEIVKTVVEKVPASGGGGGDASTGSGNGMGAATGARVVGSLDAASMTGFGVGGVALAIGSVLVLRRRRSDISAM